MQEIDGPDTGITNYKDLDDILKRLLDKHGSLKKGCMRINWQNILVKELNHAIMVRYKF